MARPTLIRIPWSHFCQKAEWGLTQAGIRYDTLDVGVTGLRKIPRISSEDTVPVLLVDGRLIEGSDKILTWASENAAEGTSPLYPEALRAQVQEWEMWAGEAVGPATRREAYRVVYKRPNKVSRNPLLHVALRVARPLVLNVMKYYKSRRFDEHDREAIPAIVANVSEELARQGTGYLVGTHATAADHAVAALLRPLIYTSGGHEHTASPGWPAIEDYVARVKPKKTSRVRRRAMTERQWRRIEAIARRGDGEEKEEKENDVAA